MRFWGRTEKGLADRLDMRDERKEQTQLLFQSHFSAFPKRHLGS